MLHRVAISNWRLIYAAPRSVQRSTANLEVWSMILPLKGNIIFQTPTNKVCQGSSVTEVEIGCIRKQMLMRKKLIPNLCRYTWTKLFVVVALQRWLKLENDNLEQGRWCCGNKKCKCFFQTDSTFHDLNTKVGRWTMGEVWKGIVVKFLRVIII